MAEAIDGYLSQASVMDSSGSRHAGLLTGEDLAGYQAELEDPVRLDYHGYTVCKTGPWGQGPVFLQQLSLLDGSDLDEMGHNNSDFVHTVVECAKLAFAGREAWYGDPRHVDVPLAGRSTPPTPRNAVPWSGQQPRTSCLPEPSPAGTRVCLASHPATGPRVRPRPAPTRTGPRAASARSR